MKVIISNRSVYHKYAEVEIEVPDGLECDDIQKWLVDNEQTYISKMNNAINETNCKFGFGLSEGMNEKDNCSEWRFAIKEDGKLTYGGHLEIKLDVISKKILKLGSYLIKCSDNSQINKNK